MRGVYRIVSAGQEGIKQHELLLKGNGLGLASS